MAGPNQEISVQDSCSRVLEGGAPAMIQGWGLATQALPVQAGVGI